MFQRYFPVFVLFQFALIFVPIMFKFDIPSSNENNIGVQKAFESIHFRIILSSCISLSVPLFLEIFRDCLLLQSCRIAYNYLTSTVPLVLVLLLPDIIFIFCVIPQDNVPLFICVHQTRMIALFSVVYRQLYVYGGHFFQQKICSIWYILACIANHLFLWQEFLSDSKSILRYITLTLTFLACLSYGLVAFIWLLNQYRVVSANIRLLSTNEYFCNVYIISSMLSFTAATVTWIAYGVPNLKNYTVGLLIGQNVAFGLFYVLVSVFHQGLMRRDLLVEVRLICISFWKEPQFLLETNVIPVSFDLATHRIISKYKRSSSVTSHTKFEHRLMLCEWDCNIYLPSFLKSPKITIC